MELDQAVFTTKYVMEGSSCIVYVVHEKDHEWQFFGNEKDISESDARIISLGEMLDLDPTIQGILWIPPGTEAWRGCVEDDWTTAVFLE